MGEKALFRESKTYKPWAVGAVLRVIVFDFLGLLVPGILDLHITTQSYHRVGKAALNFPMGGRESPSTLKSHWLKAKTARHHEHTVDISYQQRVRPVIFPEGYVTLLGDLGFPRSGEEGTAYLL